MSSKHCGKRAISVRAIEVLLCNQDPQCLFAGISLQNIPNKKKKNAYIGFSVFRSGSNILAILFIQFYNPIIHQFKLENSLDSVQI